MPRLILAAEQAAEWPTVEQCTQRRGGTTQGYTRVAERYIWHPYAGRYGIGYVCSLGPHRGSTSYQDIMYCIDPDSTSADGLAVSRRSRHWSRYQTC